MGSITSGVGLISGINSGQIIDQLISIDARPRTLLQNRISNNNNIKLAYTDLQARLTALQGTANLLIKPSTFSGATGTSSDPNSLGVTVSSTAAAGQYQFTVARTVTSQSGIASGFADPATSLVGAGTIRIGLGGGEVTTSPQLSELNGGSGVRRGTFRVTDKSGSSSTIDISSAVSLDDVVKKINNASNLQVKASIGDNGLVIEDSSGGTGSIKITEVGGGNTAADLGILGTAAGTTYTGNSINTIGHNSLLSSLNDGNGVRNKPGNTDLRITTADGTTKDITLTSKKTVGEVIDTINAAGSGKFSVALRSDGKGLKVTDLTTGSNTFEVASLNGSKAGEDLGIVGSSATTEITGTPLRGALGSVLLKNLNGGSGLGTGTLDIQDRSGTTASINTSGLSSLSDLVSAINNAGTGLKAAINKAGTGLALTDSSNGTGNVVIGSGGGGTIASTLGIEGSFGTEVSTIDSGALKRKYISEGTQLSTLNGGKGISSGKFNITNAFGQSAEIDTSLFVNGSVQDLISAVNAKGIGVTASINADGNGVLLTDNSTKPSGYTGSEGKLTVKDTSGTAAADLNLAGTASGTSKQIDGAYVKTIAVTATDTLNTVLAKLNQANAGLTAAIVNDGSGATPYRLSVNASGSGLNGRFTFDAGTTGLGLDTLVKAQNAAVFLGSASGTNPILIGSSSNTITNVVPGVSLNLQNASANPITVSVSQTADNAVTQFKSFVSTFNGLTSKIADLTKFDSTTNTKGILLGDQTVSGITDELFRTINSKISGAGRYSRLSEIGVTVGEDNQLSFNEDKFRSAYATDPAAVQRLFTAYNSVATTDTVDKTTKKTTTTTVTTPFGTETSGVKTGTDSNGNKFTTTIKLSGFGLGYSIQKSLTKLIDPTDGAIIKQNKSIDDANKLFQDRIDSLTTLLDAKKARLTKQFANMETVLAQLQNQQSSISKISTTSSSSS